MYILRSHKIINNFVLIKIELKDFLNNGKIYISYNKYGF